LDYATQAYESALNNVLDGQPDGYSKLDLHAFAVGYNFGVLIKPQPGTHVGLTYKSRLQYNFSGSAALTNVGPTLTSLGIAGDSARLKEIMPDTASISLYQEITPKFAVLGDVGWEHWSLFKSSVVYLNSGGSIAIARNWHDTVRFGLGFQYNVTDRLRGRIGAAYDSSPTGTSTRQPDLPVDRQIRTGISGEYDLTDNLTAGLSYEYADLGPSELNIQQNGLTGTLNGHYDAYAQIIGVSLRAKF
jgi:long-chain fatty acid transport protein